MQSKDFQIWTNDFIQIHCLHPAKALCVDSEVSGSFPFRNFLF